MNNDIKAYNEKQNQDDQEICNQLASIINTELIETKEGLALTPCLVFKRQPNCWLQKTKSWD